MISRRARQRRGRDDEAEVDLSPLIDVTFLLLIFFVVTATFTRDLAVDIERPSASEATEAKPKTLRVAIDASGEAYIDGARVPRWMIQRRVRQMVQRATVPPAVLIIADRRVEADTFVEVIDQCRLAGAKDVSIAVQGKGE